MVQERKFRADLYYRLNVFPITLPPLRERKADIPLLVEYFVERFATKASKDIKHIDKSALELLKAYDWPGNIRELQNVVERAVIMSESDTLFIANRWLRSVPAVFLTARDGRSALADHEVEVIEAALAESNGRISGPSGAAMKLRIPRQTLEAKIRRLGINKLGLRPELPPAALPLRAAAAGA